MNEYMHDRGTDRVLADMGKVGEGLPPIKYNKLECGHFQHPDRAGKPCAKCGHFNKLHSDPKYRAGLQYGGTPWICVLGDAIE